MTRLEPWALLLAIGGGLALLAAVATPGSLFTLIAELLSAGLLGLVALGALRARTRWPERRLPEVRVDPLGRLRGALSPNSLGRERVVFALQDLEFTSGVRTGPSWSPEEIRAILAMPADRFRPWLDGRLRRLESES